MKFVQELGFFLMVFVGTALGGILASGLDRKLTARLQWRKGPPLLQPLYDVLKLFYKEILVPREGAWWFFLAAPVVGLVGVGLVAFYTWNTLVRPDQGFSGDIFVVLYFLLFPSLAVVLAGFASKNPLASMGASREIKLLLFGELPFLLAIAVVIIKTQGAIRLGDIIAYQRTSRPLLASLSGFLAFSIALFSAQAKLGWVPFDLPEAETEIMGGPYVEYSGTPLAIFRMMRMMLLFTFPILLIVLFWGGMAWRGFSILFSFLKWMVVFLVFVLLRNTNPRIRIDQALQWFWGPLAGIGCVAVILAFLGK